MTAMFPADFGYTSARSVDEALDLLAAAQADGEEAKLLAGGQSLLPMMKLRLATPQTLVDIAGLTELTGVSNGDGTTIGALTTYRALARDPLVAGRLPAMTDALAVLADPQVRARGTIGGAVAHGDPAADLPAVLLALDAQVRITARSGSRVTPLDDFLQGVFATDLAEDEIVTAITLPPGAATGSAYEKFEQPASHLPLAGVCAAVTVENEVITSVKVAVTGVAGRPFRARHSERALVSAPAAPDSLAVAAASVAEGVRPLSDQHASGPFRLHLAEVLTRRALTRALARARTTP
ncbi:FAD binding domain-containing protein [Trebonia sp.]|uniref:FAD binding domain-containing protein n=6 Tax=Trebonia sp. TaxID=2767075 RepID=UPI003BB1B586